MVFNATLSITDKKVGQCVSDIICYTFVYKTVITAVLWSCM